MVNKESSTHIFSNRDFALRPAENVSPDFSSMPAGDLSMWRVSKMRFVNEMTATKNQKKG